MGRFNLWCTVTSFSLYDRLTKQGTLSEPEGVPDPQFALPSTVHWMRALALLVTDKPVTFPDACSFYQPDSEAQFQRSRGEFHL